MRNYQSHIDEKKRQYGEIFSAEDLNPDFIPYFENQKRVEVAFDYGMAKRGTIGMTTGWKPCFLLMLTKRSIGSSYTIGKKDKIVKVIG